MNRWDVAEYRPPQPAVARRSDLDPTPTRRVRDEVKDGVAVAVTSVAASLVLVLVATILMRLVG